jgi:hemoglobin-like flavoprotein
MNTKNHGDNIVSLFDTLFQLLGPDLDFLEEICQQVGERHCKMGVKQEFFPKMGLALLYGLEITLGDKFKEEDKDAWRSVYKKISDEILKAMK